MGFHYHWSGDAGFPASKSYDGSHPASAKKNVAYSYRVHVLVSTARPARSPTSCRAA